ncbi:hypothetical protein TNCV_2654651 [Trichonephila clavipes]|nr:hypothetical protein TNCV_2654651 [Trichonephila clavipes]
MGWVEGEEKWVTPDHPQGALPQNWVWNREKSHCHLLKAKANDRRKKLALSHDEFRGPGSDITVDQVV